MALALGKAGKSVDLHLVAGREHVFDQNANDPEVSKVYKKVISFLSLHFSDLESAQQPRQPTAFGVGKRASWGAQGL
jgi:hypothetical protein